MPDSNRIFLVYLERALIECARTLQHTRCVHRSVFEQIRARIFGFSRSRLRELRDLENVILLRNNCCQEVITMQSQILGIYIGGHIRPNSDPSALNSSVYRNNLSFSRTHEYDTLNILFESSGFFFLFFS